MRRCFIELNRNERRTARCKTCEVLVRHQNRTKKFQIQTITFDAKLCTVQPGTVSKVVVSNSNSKRITVHSSESETKEEDDEFDDFEIDERSEWDDTEDTLLTPSTTQTPGIAKFDPHEFSVKVQNNNLSLNRSKRALVNDHDSNIGPAGIPKNVPIASKMDQFKSMKLNKSKFVLPLYESTPD